MARQWLIHSPQGTDKILTAPTLFTVLSTQGNQWRKLMWFYDDWAADLDLLLSMHDLFVTDKGIFRELQSGFTSHLQSFWRRSARYAAKAAAKPNGQAYGWYSDRYLKMLDPEHLPPFRGLLLLDSGGFVLGNPSSWERMRKANNGFGPRVADLMAQLHAWETDGTWHEDEYLATGREAQQLVLETGLRVQPDILVTLDRVVHYEMSAKLKEWYIRFNLDNAVFVLQHKAQTRGPHPMFWAVLHPWGPSLTDLRNNKVTDDQALQQYYDGYHQQLTTLLREELRLGVRFDGFGIGSLVPISDNRLLGIIGQALRQAVEDTGVGDRPLHAFGATEAKAMRLQQYGVSSFDTTHHMVRARIRNALDPETGEYRKVSAGLNCACPICARHRQELDELQEDRKGVKEVATVLLALHNYHASERVHLGPMRDLERGLNEQD